MELNLKISATVTPLQNGVGPCTRGEIWFLWNSGVLSKIGIFFRKKSLNFEALLLRKCIFFWAPYFYLRTKKHSHRFVYFSTSSLYRGIFANLNPIIKSYFTFVPKSFLIIAMSLFLLQELVQFYHRKNSWLLISQFWFFFFFYKSLHYSHQRSYTVFHKPKFNIK